MNENNERILDLMRSEEELTREINIDRSGFAGTSSTSHRLIAKRAKIRKQIKELNKK